VSSFLRGRDYSQNGMVIIDDKSEL
jgi:hypothetical protein